MRGQLARTLRYSDGDVSKVTDDEIIGCYEMIFEVWGAPFEAHYQKLQGQKGK